MASASHGRVELSLPPRDGEPACTLAEPCGTALALGVPPTVVGVAVVVGVVAFVVPAPTGWPTVGSAWPGWVPAGVGSNCVQPRPASHTSGQACASLASTRNSPSANVPGEKPTATRAGSPTDARHRGVRAGELLAEPLPRVEEVLDCGGATPVDRTVEAVDEPFVLVEKEPLEAVGLLVGRRRSPHDAARLVHDGTGEAVR